MPNDDTLPKAVKPKAAKKEDVISHCFNESGVDVMVFNSGGSEGNTALRKHNGAATEEIRVVGEGVISKFLKRFTGVKDMNWSIGITKDNRSSGIAFIALPEKTAQYLKKAFEVSAVDGVNGDETAALTKLHEAAKKAIGSANARRAYDFNYAEISQIENATANVLKVAQSATKTIASNKSAATL